MVVPDLKFILYETEIEIPKDNKPKKLRPSQKHKKECRKVAEKRWQEDPHITISDMAFCDEIVDACNDKIYAEKTITPAGAADRF